MEKKLLKYPRPTLRRESFISLDGDWSFVFDDKQIGEHEEYFINFPSEHLTIKVPYAYQSKLSGINSQERHDVIWYQKEIKIHVEKEQAAILHFEASDYITKVYVNGKLATTHTGGYERFSVDVAPYIVNDAANIVVECIDTYDTHQPRGKQKWQDKPWGCWYQEINGIWRSVWIEIVNQIHIESIKLTPVEKGIETLLNFNKNNGDLRVKTEICFKNELIGCFEFDSNNFIIPLENTRYWNVDDPNLYDINFIVLKDDKEIDSIETQFGYRTIESKNAKFYINGKETFLRLALEQGYYINGIYTFENIDEMIEEVEWIKKLGFNGIRMHQKVEDERFYYLCDLFGVYVWCEMPSCYDFSADMAERVIKEWDEVVRQCYNHPSIIVWTPINESWGVKEIRTSLEEQAFLNHLYKNTKAYDPIRLVVSNDGWEHCTTDIVTLHNYVQDPERFKYFTENVLQIVKDNSKIDDMNDFIPFANGYEYNGQPIMYDEFCGIGLNLEDLEEGWGYGNSTKTKEQFFNRYKGLIKNAFESPNLAGWCMTQLTDVYIEVNGLLTMDRKPKYDISELKKVNEGIFE